MLVAPAPAVVVAHHCRSVAAAGPVVAGAILVSRKRTTVRLRAGEDIVHIRLIAAGINAIALFAERGFPIDLVLVAMQLVDIFRYDDSLGVLPRVFANAVAGVDGRSLRVGFDFDGTYFYVGGLNLPETLKYKNVQDNPKVALVIDDLESINPWRPLLWTGRPAPTYP